MDLRGWREEGGEWVGISLLLIDLPVEFLISFRGGGRGRGLAALCCITEMVQYQGWEASLLNGQPSFPFPLDEGDLVTWGEEKSSSHKGPRDLSWMSGGLGSMVVGEVFILQGGGGPHPPGRGGRSSSPKGPGISLDE